PALHANSRGGAARTAKLHRQRHDRAACCTSRTGGCPMKRWLPFPRISATLFVVWLLLNQTLSAGHILLAVVLALATSQLLARLQPPAGHLRRPITALVLAWRVLVDITHSNIAVAGIILRPGGDKTRHAGFVHIPLKTRNPYALASLACIITA